MSSFKHFSKSNISIFTLCTKNTPFTKFAERGLALDKVKTTVTQMMSNYEGIGTKGFI